MICHAPCASGRGRAAAARRAAARRGCVSSSRGASASCCLCTPCCLHRPRLFACFARRAAVRAVSLHAAGCSTRCSSRAQNGRVAAAVLSEQRPSGGARRARLIPAPPWPARPRRRACARARGGVGFLATLATKRQAAARRPRTNRGMHTAHAQTRIWAHAGRAPTNAAGRTPGALARRRRPSGPRLWQSNRDWRTHIGPNTPTALEPHGGMKWRGAGRRSRRPPRGPRPARAGAAFRPCLSAHHADLPPPMPSLRPR